MGLLNKIKQKKSSPVPEKSASVVVEKKAQKEKAPAPKKNEKNTTDASAAAGVHVHDVFVRPYVSEKSISSEARGVYTFVISTNATKVEVKNAVKALYGIVPTHIRIINTEGKRTQRGRIHGKRQDWKKAVVTLPKGKTISIHEGV